MDGLRLDISVRLRAFELELALAVGDETVALVGPSGAGKTTVLRAICGLVGYEGSISVGGSEVRDRSRRELARAVALVPQAPVLPDDMTVGEYVLLGRTPHLGYLGSEGPRDVEAAMTALERLDLLELAPRRLGSLSGGERQRAVLARALAQEASLLLLDEPTAALDVGRGQQVLALVDELRHRHALTVVSAMHDLTLAGQFAERLVLLAAGRVAAAGPPRAVLTEDLVAAHYGARVRVVAEEELGVVVVPSRAPR